MFYLKKHLRNDKKRKNPEINKTENIDQSRGTYVVTTENIFAAINENQILRPFDAVPTTAKAQCVSANRLIYGNYTLDYDLKTSDGKDVVPRLTVLTI